MVKKIRELCKEKKTSIHKLEQQLGYGNGVIGRWDKSVPSYERLSAVAAALGVSVDYLTDESKKNPAPTISESGTSGSEAKRKLVETIMKSNMDDEQANLWQRLIEKAEKDEIEE